MNKEDFLKARNNLHTLYVNTLAKHFINELNNKLKDVKYIANVYEFNVIHHSDYNTLYKSFNKNIEVDVINLLKIHYANNGWVGYFIVEKDDDSDRTWIYCNAKFSI